MKSVVYAPAALDSFDDILEYTADTFGKARAVTYGEQQTESRIRMGQKPDV